jgi:predicted CXXCH cytochrome family protein
MSCHAPHSADSRRLLRLRGNNLCLECHPKVATEPHGVTNIGSVTGHPLQTQKTVVIAGRKTRLSCLSCHEPHSSDSIRLFVFKAKEPLEICQNCHGSSRPGRF